MIAMSRDNAEPSKLFGDPGHVRQDLKLFERAVKNRWPITPETREAAMAMASRLALADNIDARVNLNAIKLLLMAEAQNQRDELGQPGHVNNTQINNTQINVTNPRDSIQELLQEPDYVEWQRQRERDSDPRFICANGHEGNGKPVDDGQPRNGD